MRVIVAGLPHSGNNLCVAHLQRSGAEAAICHGHEGVDLRGFALDRWHADALLVPTRDRQARDRAHHRSGMDDWTADRLDRAAANVAAIDLPRFEVRYEDIVATRGAALDDVLREMGVEPAPWPAKPIRPGSIHTGPVVGFPHHGPLAPPRRGL